MMGSLRSQLIGAWELHEYCAYKASDPSDKVFPLGSNAQGIIMYTPDGHMSAQLRRPGQAPFASGDGITSGTDEEWAEVGKNYVAYTGRFFLDERGAEPMLLHEMRYSNLPKLVGDIQRRTVEIQQDNGGRVLQLGVKGESMVMGEMRIIRVRWRKMTENREKTPPKL